VLGDPTVPVPLDPTAGVAGTLLSGGGAPQPGVLDTGSVLSALPATPDCTPATALQVHSTSDGAARLAFLDLHPLCVANASIFGGDALSRFELVLAGDRCQRALGCFQLLTSEVESTRALSAEGFAVISFHLLGGTKYRAPDGRENMTAATRVPLRVCWNPPPEDAEVVTACRLFGTPACAGLGQDVTLLFATGVAPLVLTESARARIGQPFDSTAAPIQLVLPGTDPVPAQPLTALTRLAVVGQTVTGSQDPGACGELQRSRCLRHEVDPTACDGLTVRKDSGDNSDSDAEAYLLLADPLPAFGIPDGMPYIESAREDVQPTLADIDGLFGAEAIDRLLEARVAYQGVSGDSVDQGPRVIGRCPAGALGCAACTRAGKNSHPAPCP
jgi:hypothetical protein